MENLKELLKWFNNLGWFSGKAELIIKIESQFEGFHGRASETWEQRNSIEIIMKDESIKVPNIKIIGERHESIDSVANRIINEIKKQK